MRKQLQKLDVNKASGPDGIPALVLRNAAAELASPLARLFQLCFNKEYMPAQWKVGKCDSMLQEGCQTFSKQLSANITAFSALKGHGKLINKSMWKHLENHKLISDRQFGFRAGHSTSDALTYIAQRLSNTINDREKPGSCVWTSAKHLIEYGIRVSWLNYAPLALLANCSTDWQTT